MPAARGDRRHARRESRDIYRRSSLNGRVVAELSIAIESPALDPAADGDCTIVGIACRNYLHTTHWHENQGPANRERERFRCGIAAGVGHGAGK